MTTPTAATPAADPTLARATLVKAAPHRVVLEKPGTNYRVHLAIHDRAPTAQVGQRVTGRLHAQARRVDTVRTGGKLIDPVIGRPRRLHGRIISVDDTARTFIVDAVFPFLCRMMEGQDPQTIRPGELVGFDIERGATFEVVE